MTQDHGRIVSAAAVALAICAPVLARDATLTISDVAYTQMCDASAAIALSDTLFVVANDEDNRLRGYTIGNPKPVFEANVKSFLDADKEADVEGSARVGDRIYWITSHGRNKDAEERPDRLNLFATRVTTANGQTTVVPEGTPYRLLLQHFIEPVMKSRGFPRASSQAPESENGLNIEGLAASGEALLIGFRNPLPRRHALVLELLNPAELIANPTALPRMGRTFELDLGGRGIRSMEALPGNQGFVIVAGSFKDDADFALYRWRGDEASPVAIKDVRFNDLRPEAMFVVPSPSSSARGPESLTLVVLSDDGDIPIDNVACKEPETPPAKKRFKAAKILLN